MKKFLPILVIAALAAGGWYWWRQYEADPGDGLRLYGNVDIRQIALAFDGTGRITELLAEEGDEDVAGAGEVEESLVGGEGAHKGPWVRSSPS